MATGSKNEGFKLVTVSSKEFPTGGDVTLPCHLTPEISAVAMEIRWFKGTDCIYLYEKGCVTVREDYEDRVSVNTQELRRGDASLRLRGSREADSGRYGCQVISGGHVEWARVGLRYDGGRGVIHIVQGTIPDPGRMKMENSVRALVNQRAQEIEKRLKGKKVKEKNEKQHWTYAQSEETEEKKKADPELLEDELLKLKKELQDKNSLIQDLTTQLQERERELEERDKQLEEREHLTDPDNLNIRRGQSMEFFVNFGRKRLLPPAVSEWASEPVSICAGFHHPDPPGIYKRWSMAVPPDYGKMSPGPAPPVSPAVPGLRLVLLGGSTAGKRAVANTFLGTEQYKREASTHTEAQHSESRQGEVAGRRVTLVETPDWFCSGLSEKDMRQDVGLCVHLSAPGPHAFLLVIPVEPSEGEERRMLEKMEDIFGEGCWGHTLILFTHAEGLREKSVEELLQTGSQELQQLVEKCGNRCHLLNVKDRPDDTQITQLLEKIEEMVSGNRERFYSSKTYQEAEKQLREIERRMQRERVVEERKLREERERREEHDKNMQESLKKMEGEIQQHEGEIRILNERTADLERKMGEEGDEETKREMERELHREMKLREETEKKLSRVRGERENREMEERRREEMEEMRESYKREAKAEAERNLMKIILTDWQRHISVTQLRMEAEFNRQMEESDREMERLIQMLKEKDREMERLIQMLEEKDREMEKMIQMLEEKDREMERMRQILEEKDREMERMRLKQRREECLTENGRLKQITVKMTREVEKLRRDVNNLSHTQSLLREVCESD